MAGFLYVEIRTPALFRFVMEFVQGVNLLEYAAGPWIYAPGWTWWHLFATHNA